MGISITNQSSHISFQFSGDKVRRIAHGSIASTVARKEQNTKIWNIRIRLTDGSSFTIKYADVTSPSTADANTLANLLLIYNSGGSNRQIYSAAAGQATFTTIFTLGTNVDVYVNGAIQATGYTWTIGGTSVVFATPMNGGEEVIIANR